MNGGVVTTVATTVDAVTIVAIRGVAAAEDAAISGDIAVATAGSAAVAAIAIAIRDRANCRSRRKACG